MSTVLFVELEGFYVARDQDDPLAVHREKQIIDANTKAIQSGIRVGMSLSEAKATSHHIRFKPYREEDYQEQRLKWLTICTEFSDTIEPLDDHIVLVDLSGHPQPQSIAGKLIAKLGRARAGIANSSWVAKLAAHEQFDPDAFRLGLCDVPMIVDNAKFLSSISVLHLEPVDPKDRERLSFLGYRTIGQVASAPYSALKGQFGKAAVVIREACLTGCPKPVRALFPEHSVRRRRWFDGAVTDGEVIKLALGELALSLSRQLIERELHGQEITMTFELEDGTFVESTRRTNKPLKSLASIGTTLDSMAKEVNLESLCQGVTSIRIALPQLRKSLPKQVNLSAVDPRIAILKPGQSGESGASALESQISLAQSAFSAGLIVKASEIEEPRRKKVLRAWRNATGWF